MSVLIDIETQIKAHVVAFADSSGTPWFELVTIGEIQDPNSTKLPRAEIVIFGSEYKADVNNTLDRYMEMVIRVRAKSRANADDIVTGLQKLWMTSAKLSDLLAVNIIQINPMSSDPPIVPHGVRGEAIIVDIHFEFVVRYDYTL